MEGAPAIVLGMRIFADSTFEAIMFDVGCGDEAESDPGRRVVER